MSNFRQRKSELHESLRKLLIKDFLNVKLTKHNKNVSRWKAQVRRFCDSAQHDGSPILTDFLCMERKGLIAPGKYEELIAMFQNIDTRAVDVILKTAADFAEIEKERKESRAMLKRFATLKSEISDSEVTEDKVKVLYDMLRQILQHSKASAHWESDLQEVPRHAGIPILRKRKSVADPEELRNSIIEKGNFISKTPKMDWKAISMMIKFVDTFSKMTNYTLERVKPDGIYIAGYEDEPRRDSQNEVIREIFAELLMNVFASLGYDMQNAAVITQMDFLEEEAFSKALKQRLSSQAKPRQESADTNASLKQRAATTPRQQPKHYDVMISYQWGSKEVVHKVKNFLERNKIVCWIDEESMKGSTLQAMAEAIEHSHIFLMCYSFKYFTSKNCRQEAEYANKLQKIIIPLKMQRDYEPRGWLGMILGEKLFFEFSGKYPFDQKAKELLTEILFHLQNPPEMMLPENVIPSENGMSESADISQNRQIESRENSEKSGKYFIIMKWIDYVVLSSVGPEFLPW
ncbi:uncharacterized protein LOC133199678 [Saccostrea echinata]|uniref:uncharacterized protein LOC133199678 n=1 Tax=Saccostrea echinata TaxID=191078 RepID=UPI002A80E090|nr:uncharacterized protein LOC133199678 [Saccostrea echinata]